MKTFQQILLWYMAIAFSVAGLRPADSLPAAAANEDPVEIGSGKEGFSHNRKLPELDNGSSVSDYLEYAALNNPSLEASFNRWKASLEKVSQARSLPDPRFTYSYFIREVETRVGPQRQKFGIAQKFPWPGKLALHAQTATEEAGAQEQRFQAARLKLYYEVKTAFYDYYYLSRSLAVTSENLQLLTSLESVARAKYTTGEAGYSAIIKAQVELGKMEDRLKSLEDYRGALAAGLNSVLNRPVGAPLPWPAEIDLAEVELNEERLFALLSERNPELKSLDFQADKEKTAVELAKKDFYPDITLGLDYLETGPALMPSTIDDGKDPLMAMVSINLPLNRGKYRAGEREAIRRHNAALLERRDRENRLLAELKATLFNFRDAGRKLGLYRQVLIPKAEQSLNTARQAFIVSGNVDFLELIDAQRTLLEFQLSYEKSVVERAESLAKIEMLVGTDDLSF